MNNYNFKGFSIETPVLLEDYMGSSKWVGFGGDNMYPRFLRNILMGSPIHKKCIDVKTRACVGNGLSIREDASMNNILLLKNSDGDNWNEVFAKCIYDYMIYGAFCVGARWNTLGTKVVEIYHMDVSKIRSGQRQIDERVRDYWMSWKWTDWTRKKEFYPRRVAAFNPSVASEAAIKSVQYGAEGNTKKQEFFSNMLDQYFYAKNYFPDFDFYGVPDYFAGINAIQWDKALSDMNISDAANSYSPSIVIGFPFPDPGPDMAEKYFDVMQATNAGPANAGRPLLLYGNTKDELPEVTVLDRKHGLSNIDTLQKVINETIVHAHGINDATVVGLESKIGGLGNTAEMVQKSWEKFLIESIKPLQILPLKTFDTMLKNFGYPNLSLEILPLALFPESEIVDNKIETKDKI